MIPRVLIIELTLYINKIILSSLVREYNLALLIINYNNYDIIRQRLWNEFFFLITITKKLFTYLGVGLVEWEDSNRTIKIRLFSILKKEKITKKKL